MERVETANMSAAAFASREAGIAAVASLFSVVFFILWLYGFGWVFCSIAFVTCATLAVLFGMLAYQDWPREQQK